MSYTASQNHPAWVQNARIPLSKWHLPSKRIKKKTQNSTEGEVLPGQNPELDDGTLLHYVYFLTEHWQKLGDQRTRLFTAKVERQGLERLSCLSQTMRKWKDGVKILVSWVFPSTFLTVYFY